jgi:L-threonine-O-3-phosphate decarboxylase
LNRPVHGGNLVWAATLAGCPGSLILDFSASINPLGPPPNAIAAIQRNLALLTAYPDPDYSQLRSALAKWHQLSPAWILPGNGSAELLTWASRELSHQDITHLVTPAFGDYWRSLQAFAANVRLCPINLTSGHWSAPIENEPVCLSQGLLINNPHNPTGQLWTQDMILPYLKTCALVVVDEAFMDFVPPHHQQSLIDRVQDYPNLVILRSLTKFYSLPGLRLGYAVAHPDRLKRWQQWRDPWPVNVLAAIAGEVALQDRAFQQKTWDWLLPAREELFKKLALLPGLSPLPSAANFLLVRSEQPSSQVQEKLLKYHRIFIRDCLSFPELGDRYFRVAIRSPADNQRLLEGLAAVLDP